MLRENVWNYLYAVRCVARRRVDGNDNLSQIIILSCNLALMIGFVFFLRLFSLTFRSFVHCQFEKPLFKLVGTVSWTADRPLSPLYWAKLNLDYFLFKSVSLGIAFMHPATKCASKLDLFFFYLEMNMNNNTSEPHFLINQPIMHTWIYATTFRSIFYI